MKLDYSDTWAGALALLKANKEAVIAITGVFIFLPSILVGQFVGEPDVAGITDTAEMQSVTMAFMFENLPYFMLSNLVVAFGSLALYIIFSPSHQGTVGETLKLALKLFLFFFLANLLVAAALLLGLLAFIIPALYLFGRFLIVPMVVADRNETNPLAAVRQGWEITKDNGWSIFLFFLIIAIIAIVTILVVSLFIGIIVGLATGGAGLPFVENLFGALVGSTFQAVFIAVAASIYRQLTAANIDVERVFN